MPTGLILYELPPWSFPTLGHRQCKHTNAKGRPHHPELHPKSKCHLVPRHQLWAEPELTSRNFPERPAQSQPSQSLFLSLNSVGFRMETSKMWHLRKQQELESLEAWSCPLP